MIEPTRRFQVLKLFRKQDKLFRKVISQRVFSGCSVAFGDQNYQFIRSFGHVSEFQIAKVIELAKSAQTMLKEGKNFEDRADGCWVWGEVAHQIFGIFLVEGGAPDALIEEFYDEFRSQLVQHWDWM